MPITPTDPFPKKKGNNIRSDDWNQIVNEVIRLDNAKINKAGDTFSGPITGPLTIQGAALPDGILKVDGDIHINDHDLLLRSGTDKNHGVGWYGPGKAFAAATPDGPVVYGWSGGGLGTTSGGQKLALFWKSDGKVGVGTTDPHASLHVQGPLIVSGANSGLGMINATLAAVPDSPGVGDRYVWDNPNGSLRLSTGNAVSLLTVSKSGDMTLQSGELIWGNFSGLKKDQGGSIELGGNSAVAGAGTPYIDFHFNGLKQDYNARIINDSDGSLSIQVPKVSLNGALSFGSAVRQMINLWSTNYGIGVQGWTQYFRTDRNFAWYVGGAHNDNELNPGTGGVVQMVIQNGNLGIGTAAPGMRLDVAGGGGSSIDFRVNGRMQSNNNDGGLWIAADRFMGGHSTNKMGFWTGAAWRFTVQNDGSTGIGTTNPGTMLHVVGNRIRLENGGKTLDMRADGGALDLESSTDLYLNNNGIQVWTRNLKQISSRELKENIQAFSGEDALKYLSEVDPVRFNYKDDAQKAEQLGFIAEDTPEMLSTPDRKGITPMHFITMLTRVAQEQQKMIVSLREQIQVLNERSG